MAASTDGSGENGFSFDASCTAESRSWSAIATSAERPGLYTGSAASAGRGLGGGGLVVIEVLLGLPALTLSPVIAVAGILYTIPSLALFGFLIPLMGIGVRPALFALILYAQLVLIRNTYVGILAVDPAALEAGRLAPEHTDRDAISAAACQVAATIGAAAIVSFTSSGATALRAARERPAAPILVLTPNIATARRLALLWGAHCVHLADITSFAEVVQKAVRTAQREEIAGPGQRVGITAGVPLGTPGSTNLLRSARCARSSLCRVTTTRLSSTATRIAGCTTRSSDPFGPFTRTARSATVTSTPAGISIGNLPTRDIVPPSAPHQMKHSTSPPIPALRASRSVMTPRLVETIATPRPPRTRGRSARRA